MKKIIFICCLISISLFSCTAEDLPESSTAVAEDTGGQYGIPPPPPPTLP